MNADSLLMLSIQEQDKENIPFSGVLYSLHRVKLAGKEDEFIANFKQAMSLLFTSLSHEQLQAAADAPIDADDSPSKMLRRVEVQGDACVVYTLRFYSMAIHAGVGNEFVRFLVAVMLELFPDNEKYALWLQQG